MAGSKAQTKVTVIVAAYNAADTIGRCLTHLLAQDYPERRVVVVDNGSSDDTVALARRHPVAEVHEYPGDGRSMAGVPVFIACATTGGHKG